MPTVLLGVERLRLTRGSLKNQSLEEEAVGKVMAKAQTWRTFAVSDEQVDALHRLLR